MDKYTQAHLDAVLEALGLDADATTSVYLDRHWIRIEHADHTVTGLQLTQPQDEPAA